ncbi:hypothetical protein J4573_40795 [Actinomadura barringtoniae]|uniref:DUF4386 family protein n=1 Tax=Actinomadura barringtoniae TaxID=1427535 RepID=A0A939T7V0_9ACTN|nr:hypothetical protein [Actinomadura barringtoniae]MBO2453488.1 hypothetical protein [Actinomadura barringtoniae]
MLRTSRFGFAFHAAPALMLTYGVIRLIDGRDGTYGPGLAWTVGHVLFLGALVLYGLVTAGLWRQMPAGGTARRTTAGIAAGLSALGLVAFIRVAIIDIVVGLKAADHAEKSTLAHKYADVPNVLPSAVYDTAPMLFMLGLTVLLVQHAVIARRATVALSPVAGLLGFAVIAVNLNLLPLGAALIWLSLLPFARPNAHRTATEAVPA